MKFRSCHRNDTTSAGTYFYRDSAAHRCAGDLIDLYEAWNHMGYDEACEREVELGIKLREAGFGVWQG